MVARQSVAQLIETILRRGDYTTQGRRAIKRLARTGDRAVEAIVATLKRPPETDLHPVDVRDLIQAVFCELARTAPQKVLALLEDRRLDDPSPVYWALGYARGHPSLDALIAGLNHQNQYVRWAAAESLIRRRAKRAVHALVQALKDRSRLARPVQSCRPARGQAGQKVD
jgi:hypothetical protein